MKQKVIRKTLTGSLTPFTFDVKACSFLIVNFSDANAYISFEDGVEDSECLKVPPKCSRPCFYNLNSGYYTETIYVKGTGEVEVQPIDF